MATKELKTRDRWQSTQRISFDGSEGMSINFDGNEGILSTIFPLTNLRKKPRFMSGHNPLILCSDQDRRKKQNNSVLKLPGLNTQNTIKRYKKYGKRR
jgi:hypothetical protein